jgi:hypothetical protein
MSKHKTAQPDYAVSVYDDPHVPGGLRFTFVPKGFQQARTAGELPKPVPEYIVSVRNRGEPLAFSWLNPPDKETIKARLEEIVRERVEARTNWILRVANLVQSVETWAKDLGWSTKRIEKRIEDPGLDNHKAPGLVMQEDTVRILLEPISASAPGSDGLVDLYLMPGYDDIANLFHREGGWHIHYVFPTQKTVSGIKEGETRPLTKKNLALVLEAMKKHAE